MRTRWSTLPLTLAVLYSGLHAGLAGAATPASGTVSDRNATLSYSSGPFLLPNTSAKVDLEPGASVDVSLVWPTTRTRGTHVLTAIADPDNSVAESNESNNKTQASVYIK